MFYGHAMLIGGKPERIEIFIVSGLSLSRPVDTKTDLKLNNIIATPSSNLILTPLDECQSWWASTIRDMRPWRYNLCTLRLVRVKLPLHHWNLRNLTLQQECYLTTGMLPYKHSSRALEILTAYTVLSHGSIMLRPRQPRVFARLARWQLWKKFAWSKCQKIFLKAIFSSFENFFQLRVCTKCLSPFYVISMAYKIS